MGTWKTVDDLPYVISVTRTGGLAGLRREWSVEVSVPVEAEGWRSLIDACPWEVTATRTDPDPVRDGFTWSMRAAQHEAVLPERMVEGPWQTLVEAVQHAAPSNPAQAPRL